MKTISFQYMSNQLCMLLSGVEKHGSVCNAELVNCSLYLLQNVPATRNAVLEYLSLVFEEAAAVQLKQDNRSQGIQVTASLNVMWKTFCKTKLVKVLRSEKFQEPQMK